MVLILEIFVAGCITILAFLLLTLVGLWSAVIYYVAQIIMLVLYIICAVMSYKILRIVLRLVVIFARWIGIILSWMGTILRWLWRWYSRKARNEGARVQMPKVVYPKFTYEERYEMDLEGDSS
jgi:hypothetical protein